MNGVPILETDVVGSLFDWLVWRGFLVLRINSGAFVGEHAGKRRYVQFVRWQVLGRDISAAGVLDILAIAPLDNGRLIAIEAKRPGKLDNVSDEQSAFLMAVINRGGVGIVADSIETLERALLAAGVRW